VSGIAADAGGSGGFEDEDPQDKHSNPAAQTTRVSPERPKR